MNVKNVMEKEYVAPGIEVFDLVPETVLLAVSGPDFGEGGTDEFD